MNEVTKRSGIAKAAQVVAIIVFALILSALLFAIISDIAIFAQQIFSFFFACVAGVFVFLIGCILMVVSIVFIFGIYLLADRGFWPIQWASETFKQIINDNKITQQQISTFGIIRVVLIVICVLCLILAVIALSLNKTTPKSERAKVTTPFGVISLIFSILGIVAALGMIFIVGSLG